MNKGRHYTKRDDEIIREGYSKGRRVKDIADDLGRQRTNILQRAMKLGLKHPNPALGVKPKCQPKTEPKPRQHGRPPRVWTAEDDEIVRAGHRTLLPLKRVAVAVGGVSAPTIVRRERFLGLPPRGGRKPAAKPEQQTRASREQRRVVRSGQGTYLAHKTVPMALPASDEPLLRHRGCQWIDGPPTARDECKCLAPVEPGRPYCLEHLERTVIRAPAKARTYQDFRYY